MTTIIWALIGLTGLFALIQICYYLFVFSKFAFDKNESESSAIKYSNVPVTVLVYAKNEVKNIRQFLPLILAQNYPDYEVIVVNDGSWDETTEYLEELQKTEPRLKLVDIQLEERYHRGKKFALTLGIKSATHEWLLFTNADCKPVNENWIREMSAGMRDDKEIVLGYSRYKQKNSFLNLFIRWANFFTAMTYFSFAMKNKAIFGVGRNLAYRKSLFFNVKGFATHQHIMTGDDALFVNETAKKNSVAVVYTRDSFTESQAKVTWKTYWQLQKRHFHNYKFYKSSHKRSLSWFSVSHVLFYVLLCLSLVFGIKFWPYILGIFLLRLIVQGIVLFKSMEKLRISKIFSLFGILDILMIPYYLTVGLAGVAANKLR